MFAIETANLILARILLIRFFEDHGFFGPHRYVCNGGIAAFQKWREAFAHSYTRLLKDAYEKAQHLYAAAFDETELDWVFGTNDAGLSNAIEWAMYQLSRYDFTTVKGDILTGIYDRFLDREQRKRFGEYYTPPSIARYIIDRLDLQRDHLLLDAACGSGTFLIERYQQTIGEDADRGIATFNEALDAIKMIAGNDLNTFSAVLAQIQLLWHLLTFRDELMRDAEFPDIAITNKVDSLVRSQLELSGRFAELDQPIYAAVVGNPPYVRKERAGEIDQATKLYFETPRSKPGELEAWHGISAEANLYALFIYRALDSWCRTPDRWGQNAGKLGYVVPLALCGTNENSNLRDLFGPAGRWTIKEIVDLEVIWRYVFDADVLPVILICEARRPRLPIDPKLLDSAVALPDDLTHRYQVRAARLDRWLKLREERADRRGDAARKRAWRSLINKNLPRWAPDRVMVKLPDKSCIDFYEGDKRPAFRLNEVPSTQLDYAQLFTADGRIRTRLNDERIQIIEKLRKNERLECALQTYWYKKSGTDHPAWQINKPASTDRHWEQREMISRGLVFAGRKKSTPKGKGHKIYKAENILAGAIFGEPQDIDVDPASARNQYLFQYSDILPSKMWAVARIATCPNAVAFDPKKVAFTDTATIFAPKKELMNVPFDLLFLSKVYRYFYVLECRMSYLNLCRGDIYPTNLRLLPWSDTLAKKSNSIEAFRQPLQSACETAFNTREAMFNELSKLALRPLKDVVRAKGGAKLIWSESFIKGVEKIELTSEVIQTPAEEGVRLQISQYMFDWIVVTSEEIALSLKIALQVRAGEPVDREDILNFAIPLDEKTRIAYIKIVERYRTADHHAVIEKIVDDIDVIVGPVLGLTLDDVAAIRKDMSEDPFLKKIRPRYPASETRIHGYRTGLDSSDRYD